MIVRVTKKEIEKYLEIDWKVGVRLFKSGKAWYRDEGDAGRLDSRYIVMGWNRRSCTLYCR